MKSSLPAVMAHPNTLRPPEVFGREAEVAQALRALHDGDCAAVVLSGIAGIGKSVVAATTVSRAVPAGSLVGHGQHRFGQDGDTLAPLISALEQAVSAGLDQLHDPQSGFDLLKAALGKNAALLAHESPGVFAAFDAALNEGKENLAGAEQMYSAVLVVLRWLIGFAQPVVLWIDDWGRARGRAAEFYQRILGAGLRNVTIVATERLDERFDTEADVERVVVGKLSRQAECALVASCSGFDLVEAEALLRAAAGAYETPLELSQAMRSLVDIGGITQNADGRRSFDRNALLRCFGASGCVQLLARCEASAPGAMLIAQCAAMLGSFAQVDDLKRVSGLALKDFDRAISILLDAGVIERGTHALSHDNFAEAAFGALSVDRKASLSAAVADALRARGVPGRDGALRQIMLDCLLQGGKRSLQEWVVDLTDGAAFARATGDVERAVRFAEAALSARTGDEDVPFRTLQEGVFAALESGDHGLAIERAERLAAKAVGRTQQALAAELLVIAYRMGGHTQMAVSKAKDVLRGHGVVCPANVRAWEVLFEVVRIAARDPKRAAMQPMTTPAELAAIAPLMRALATLGPILYEQDSKLAFVIGSRALSDRMAAATAAGAATQALLCSEAGLYRRAAKWGELSETRQGADQPLRALASHFAAGYGHLHSPHRRETGRGRAIAELAFADGDLGTAAISLQYEVWDKICGEGPLGETLALGEANRKRLASLREEMGAVRISAGLELIRRLKDGGVEAWRLDDAAVPAQDSHLKNASRGVTSHRAMLGAAYGAYEQVAAVYDQHGAVFNQAPFHAQTLIWSFMTGVALYKSGRRPHWLRRWALARAASANPRRFQHRVTLFKAESARQRGDTRKALELYSRAVEQARGAACYLELGIVAEAAHEGCVELGFLNPAARFRETAAETWRRYEALGVLKARGHAPVRQDDTEREAALRTSKARARFLALVGHELRTPLQGLSGLLELAAATGERPDLQSLQTAVEHLRRVVADLVDLAAADGGALSIKEDPIRLTRLVDDLSAILLSAPENLGLKVRVTSSEDLAVRGDGARIRQILTNLVFNAWAHAKTACEIEVTATTSKDERIALKFRVMDRGPGVPIEKLARLLEPFQRGAESGGLGLGLAVSHSLAKAMGGALSVADREGGGATFCLTVMLPLARLEDERATQATIAARKVLVVEDDDLGREVLAALIRLEGADVSEADGYRAAAAVLEKESFDAIIIDRALGDGDGLALLRQLKADAIEAACIIVSASAPDDLRREAFALGASAVLEKPVARASLREALRTQPAERPTSERIEELRAALKDEVERLFAAVGPNVMSALERIDAAADRDDWVTVRGEAHKLRGLAVNFGLTELAAAASEVESGGADLSALRAAVAAAARSPLA